MGSLYVFDGPEKSGKTTVIKEIAYLLLGLKYGVTVRRWGPIEPDDRLYSAEVLQASSMPENHITLWDRSWAAEHVYGSLLGRDRRLSNDPWLATWLHERPLNTIGKGTLVLAPSVEWSRERRDETDIKCDPYLERKMFVEYSLNNGWDCIVTSEFDGPMRAAQEWYLKTFKSTQERMKGRLVAPPGYFGPPDASVVIVGSEDAEGLPGSWGPFKSKAAIRFGREFGYHVKDIGWATSHECPPAPLRQGRAIIVSVGEAANLWVRHFVSPWNLTDVVAVKSPAWVYRNGASSAPKGETQGYATLAQRVKNFLEANKNGKVQQVPAR